MTPTYQIVPGLLPSPAATKEALDDLLRYGSLDPRLVPVLKELAEVQECLVNDMHPSVTLRNIQQVHRLLDQLANQLTKEG